MTSDRRRQLQQLAAVFAASLSGGLLFHLLDLPVAWLLGPMLAGVLLALLSRKPTALPHMARAGAQIVLGVAVGLRLSPDAFWGLGKELPLLLVLVGATGGLSMLNGYILSKVAGVDPATGFLGSIPGAASSMVAIGADVGADPRLVAVLQYLRVLLVALLVPFLVEKAAPHLVAENVPASSPVLQTFASPVPTLGAVSIASLLALYAVGGWAVGRALRLPSASFLGPFMVAAASTFVLGSLPFPEWLFNAALLVLGAWIGVQFDGPFIKKLGRIALVETLLIILLIAGTALLGFAFSRVTGIHLVTALLASSPGAMEAMVALSLKLGAHTPLVISMQMLRFLAMLFLGPWIARGIIRRVKRATPQHP